MEEEGMEEKNIRIGINTQLRSRKPLGKTHATDKGDLT